MIYSVNREQPVKPKVLGFTLEGISPIELRVLKSAVGKTSANALKERGFDADEASTIYDLYDVLSEAEKELYR